MICCELQRAHVTELRLGTTKSYYVLQCSTPVLLCTAKYYSSSTPCYQVLLRYYCVLESTTPVLLRIPKYYKVLQSTTPYYKVLQSIAKYYSVLFVLNSNKVRPRTTNYHKVPQSITRYTTPYCDWTLRVFKASCIRNFSTKLLWKTKLLCATLCHAFVLTWRIAAQNTYAMASLRPSTPSVQRWNCGNQRQPGNWNAWNLRRSYYWTLEFEGLLSEDGKSSCIVRHVETLRFLAATPGHFVDSSSRVCQVLNGWPNHFLRRRWWQYECFLQNCCTELGHENCEVRWGMDDVLPKVASAWNGSEFTERLLDATFCLSLEKIFPNAKS